MMIACEVKEHTKRKLDCIALSYAHTLEMYTKLSGLLCISLFRASKTVFLLLTLSYMIPKIMKYHKITPLNGLKGHWHVLFLCIATIIILISNNLTKQMDQYHFSSCEVIQDYLSNLNYKFAYPWPRALPMTYRYHYQEVENKLHYSHAIWYRWSSTQNCFKYLP